MKVNMNSGRWLRCLKISLLTLVVCASFSPAALTPEFEQIIKRYVAKNPMVANLQTEVEFLDPAPNLQSCPEKLEISLQPGTRLWGRTNLELRCKKLAWTYNLSIKVRVMGEYVVANRYLQANIKLSKGDLNTVQGDLAELPDDVLRFTKDAYGRVLTRPIQMGMKLSLNDIKELSVVSQGDRVSVVITGPSFEATGDGVAMSAGMIGDAVTVKLLDGQTVTGRVKEQGVVVVKTQ